MKVFVPILVALSLALLVLVLPGYLEEYWIITIIAATILLLFNWVINVLFDDD